MAARTDLPWWTRPRKMGDKTSPGCPPWCTSGPHDTEGDEQFPRALHQAIAPGDAVDCVIVSICQRWTYARGWEAPQLLVGQLRAGADHIPLYRPENVRALAAVIDVAGGDAALVEYLGKVAERFGEILADPATPQEGWL